MGLLHALWLGQVDASPKDMGMTGLGDGQTEVCLTDMGMTGLAMARRRSV